MTFRYVGRPSLGEGAVAYIYLQRFPSACHCSSLTSGNLPIFVAVEAPKRSLSLWSVYTFITVCRRSSN